jgi:Tfp pilus assembly protein PilV
MAILGLFLIFCVTQSSMAQQSSKQQWKTLPFAIVRYNDDAPKSWNVYRGERKGIYLVRLWKRYLLVDTDSQDVFEIDPEKVKAQGESAELAAQDIPADPLETTEWKTKNAGPVLRHRFRFGKSGNFMELQIPVLPNGRPAY